MVFNNALEALRNQADRAMFALIGKCKKLCLPVDIQLQLFDALVKPILLYGSEVWGYENIILLERLQLKFLKILLNVNRSTTNNMVYGELGCLPIGIYVKCRMINF
jgi:sialic acid synthase SpsE